MHGAAARRRPEPGEKQPIPKTACSVPSGKGGVIGRGGSSG
jgi:hypothetical protein